MNCIKTERAGPTDKLIFYDICKIELWAVQYLKRARTGRENKQSLQPIRIKTNSWTHGFPRWALLHVSSSSSSCFGYCILCVSTCYCFNLTIVIRKPLTATNIIDFLCEKLFVTYQICSFLFSANFVDTMSKALEIPKWRLFNVRTEDGDEEGCLIVKFGIIGTGNSALPCHLFCGVPPL